MTEKYKGGSNFYTKWSKLCLEGGGGVIQLLLNFRYTDLVF